jgi:hypothetical protein
MESPKKLRVALDAMGGDYAPEREVAGAIEALKASRENFEIVLVGDEPAIRRQLVYKRQIIFRSQWCTHRKSLLWQILLPQPSNKRKILPLPLECGFIRKEMLMHVSALEIPVQCFLLQH